MINKALLTKRFNLNAKTYDDYANVQKIMADKLLDLLQAKYSRREEINILEVGCGTGYLTEKLLLHFPSARITAVDIAPGMVEVCRKRLRNTRVQFIIGDIEEVHLTANYDLIVSNAAFQWLNYPSVTIERLFFTLKDNGMFCFSTFGNQTFQELNTAFFVIANNRAPKLNRSPVHDFLSAQELFDLCSSVLNIQDEFSIIKVEEDITVERFPSVREFFLSIKKIGANNSNPAGYCPPSILKEVMKFYERNYSHESMIKATYHCLFAAIQKKNLPPLRRELLSVSL